jgi:hypothetical protein
MYEDDGVSFNCDRGEFMRLRARWDDHQRQLTLSLVEGSKMLGPSPLSVEVRIAGSDVKRQLTFEGKTRIVQL